MWFSVCFLGLADAARIQANMKGTTADDILDLSPLFQQVATASNALQPSQFLHPSTGSHFRCCCHDRECVLADLNVKNSCDSESDTDEFARPQPVAWLVSRVRDRNRCGCLAGFGYRSFDHDATGECLIPASSAMSALGMQSTEEVLQEVATAAKTRYVQGMKVSYGECWGASDVVFGRVSRGTAIRTSCGVGARQITQHGLDVMAALPLYSELQDAIAIPCKETWGCNWKCSHEKVSCGWGKVTCLDDAGNAGSACDEKGMREADFDRQSDVEMQCFEPCPEGEGSTSASH